MLRLQSHTEPHTSSERYTIQHAWLKVRQVEDPPPSQSALSLLSARVPQPSPALICGRRPAQPERWPLRGNTHHSKAGILSTACKALALDNVATHDNAQSAWQAQPTQSCAQGSARTSAEAEQLGPQVLHVGLDPGMQYPLTSLRPSPAVLHVPWPRQALQDVVLQQSKLVAFKSCLPLWAIRQGPRLARASTAIVATVQAIL